MAEVRDFLLPDLGEGLAEAEIVDWLVAAGDRVEVDQPVVEVATEKATVQVPVPFAGTVVTLHAAPGDMLAVGRALLSVDVGAGGDRSAAPAAPVPAPAAAAPEAAAGPPDAAGTPDAAVAPDAAGAPRPLLVGSGASASPRRRRRVTDAATAGVPPAPPGTAATARSDPSAPPRTAAGAPAAPEPGTPRIPSSPLARRLAAELDVDLARVRGTGPGGAVTRSDIERHVAPRPGRPAAVPEPGAMSREAGPARPAAAEAGPAAPAPDVPPADAEAAAPPARDPRRLRLTGARRLTAARLARSHAEVPAATAWLTVDATRLLALRDLLDHRAGDVHVTPLAVLLRLCVASLRRFPVLNATFDAAGGETVLRPDVDLGVAVQTPRGLLVPVIRGAHQRSAIDLAAELSRLATGARQGTLAAHELTGSTFTVSNLGALGVDGGAPIVNPGEAAILGVGRIARRPWVVGDDVVARQTVELSLVFDHRVCDGGEAGGMLSLLGDYVEHPELVLGDT